MKNSFLLLDKKKVNNGNQQRFLTNLLIGEKNKRLSFTNGPIELPREETQLQTPRLAVNKLYDEETEVKRSQSAVPNNFINDLMSSNNNFRNSMKNITHGSKNNNSSRIRE